MTAPATAPKAAEFSVRLENFEGPFDLLLSLIAKHKLDVTTIALSMVTDEFIAHIKAQGPAWDLEQTSQFLVVAATLLDLKTARLLPQGDIDDEEDLALLEARDLLFARLLQYRAFKQVAGWLETTLADQGQRFIRPGGLEPEYARLLPEVELTISLAEFAALASAAMEPRAMIEVSIDHVHGNHVSVAEQAAVVSERLRRHTSASFRTLISDSPDTLTTVARFLALLELFRAGSVTFDQMTPLGELVVRWAGDDTDAIIVDEYDDAASPEETDVVIVEEYDTAAADQNPHEEQA